MGGEEIDSVGANSFIVLVHARPSTHGRIPIEVGEGWWWGFCILEPLSDFEMGGEKGVGFGSSDPFEEGGLISRLKPPDTFDDFVEGFACGGLRLEEGGGEATVEDGIDGRGDNEAWAFFSYGVELANGIEGGGVLVVGGAVDGG